MKVCILGDNLTSLALAKALVKKEIFVDLFYEKKNTKIDSTRTIGISKSNIDFFNREITNIKRMLWPIKKIKIFTENSKDKEILKFEDQKDNLFSILQNLLERFHNLPNIICTYQDQDPLTQQTPPLLFP